MTIEVNGVKKSFGKKSVLRGVTLTVEPERIYALLGRNGVGKSTLLAMINNRLLPSGGTITMDGENVIDNEGIQNRIYLMSDANYFPGDKRVEWVFKTTEALFGGFDHHVAARMVQNFGVDVHAKVRSLSTGQTTIMKLICALAVPADYVLLDEPVLGLDAANRELFYDEILRVFGERPRTFVIATHLIEEIAQMVDHVFVIVDGQTAVDADTEELLGTARTLTGTISTVHAATAGLTVLRHKDIGNMRTAIVAGVPADFTAPADVDISGVDLQSMFIALTGDEARADE